MSFEHSRSSIEQFSSADRLNAAAEYRESASGTATQEATRYLTSWIDQCRAEHEADKDAFDLALDRGDYILLPSDTALLQRCLGAKNAEELRDRLYIMRLDEALPEGVDIVVTQDSETMPYYVCLERSGGHVDELR